MTIQKTSSSSTLRADAISHDYSGVVVLTDVELLFRTGAVEGVVGENGSGKTTLITILTGAQRPASGELSIDGRSVSFASPADAQNEGVGVVHQDYNLVTDLTVAENVFRLRSRPPRRRWSRLVDRGAVDRRVEDMFASLGVDVPPGAVIRSLPAAERKFVEIARAMLLAPRFLVLDEPTASLEPEAADKVLGLIDRLRSRGVGILFVSHRLDEVLRIADHVTVLRDGRVVGRLDEREATEEGLARLIVGEGKRSRPVAEPRSERERAPSSGAAPALRLFGVRAADDALGSRLEVAAGEILGLTGLLGSGATEVTRMLGGVAQAKAEAEVFGMRVAIKSPHDARRAGIGFIPEDRKALGIVPEQSVATNVSLASLSSVARSGVLSRSRIDQRASEYRDKLGIKIASIHSLARTLSGGNAQKVLIARWLASGVRVLVVEEPTHGIDVGAKTQVHALLAQFADAGGAIVMASTDVREILSLCDRIAIFHHGVLHEVLSADALSEARLQAGRSATDAQHLLERLITGSSNGR